jgi:dolichol kinase
MTMPAGELRALPFGAAVRVPVTRPTNVTRSLFHVASGVVSLALLRLLPGRAWLIVASGAFFVAAWSMELARRRSGVVNERLMRFFAPIAHPHERHQVNSSTWYVTALLLLSLVSPLRAAEVGVVVLAVADPMAGLMGRRFGRIRLRAGRSLEGTLAFLVSGVLAVLALLTVFHGMLPWPTRVVLAGAGAVAGALAELFSGRLDDNFTIPVASTAAVAAAQLLLPTL